jgi:hypothetical protein
MIFTSHNELLAGITQPILVILMAPVNDVFEFHMVMILNQLNVS